jgi:hypothetical protein
VLQKRERERERERELLLSSNFAKYSPQWSWLYLSIPPFQEYPAE